VSPFFSVITVTKNAENTIERCIRSVETQSFGSVEHILVDGLSSDSTLERVKDAASRKGTRISRVLSEPDRGIYHAMNKGLALAKGEWVYYLNADDYLFGPETLTHTYNILRDNKTGLFYGRLLCVDDKTGNASLHAPRKIDKFRIMSGGLYQQAWFFQRILAERVGSFDESYRICGDVDYLSRILRAGIRAEVRPILVAVFSKGGASSNFDLVKKEHRRVELAGVDPLTWLFYKVWRSLLRVPMKFLRQMSKTAFD
jgi:glycosyltransferase involved in cell wall biosynthesis